VDITKVTGDSAAVLRTCAEGLRQQGRRLRRVFFPGLKAGAFSVVVLRTTWGAIASDSARSISPV